MKKAAREETEAARRTQLLLDVMAGRKTASEAAATLAISRKSWHRWQRTGLSALLRAMTHGDPGRPRKAAEDPELARLRKLAAWQAKRIAQLERTIMIIKAASGLTIRQAGLPDKKKGRKRP